MIKNLNKTPFQAKLRGLLLKLSADLILCCCSAEVAILSMLKDILLSLGSRTQL